MNTLPDISIPLDEFQMLLSFLIVVMAGLIGEMHDKWFGALFLRKSFITMAAQALDPEVEEIIQEFIDFAKKQSFEVREF